MGDTAVFEYETGRNGVNVPSRPPPTFLSPALSDVRAKDVEQPAHEGKHHPQVAYKGCL